MASRAAALTAVAALKDLRFRFLAAMVADNMENSRTCQTRFVR